MNTLNPTLKHASEWIPACGGTEKPFTVQGRSLLYMWNRATGEHAYYDIRRDLFLSNEDAQDLLNPQLRRELSALLAS